MLLIEWKQRHPKGWVFMRSYEDYTRLHLHSTLYASEEKRKLLLEFASINRPYSTYYPGSGEKLVHLDYWREQHVAVQDTYLIAHMSNACKVPAASIFVFEHAGAFSGFESWFREF